jgi:two-component system sporulation sensor kinase A
MKLEKSKRLSDVGMLAATVAHELRNPLATISMAAYGIKQEAASPGIIKHLATIEKKIKESDQIISNLLFYSRIKPPHYENVNIFDIIEESINFIQTHRERSVEIVKDNDSLKDIVAMIDPLQIKEVFFNVLNNAYDAIVPNHGKIEISGKYEAKFIEIIIKDNGRGMNKETIAKIFEPFFTTKAKGTGLGLVVCQQIMRLHNGSISLESEVGRGTTVAVRFPKVKGDASVTM